ncbi:MAG TPA: ABC-F family ATP-binding cassette domain-containing protein, partial [Spirochaetia bacterium]|nr:ABC-F family ATP-binding cassette domain-containing protein [Spirochaetia bacterium]
MPSIALTEVSHAFGPNQIFEAVNFTITTGDRIALTGANGTGKSTLMRILVGELKPDLGRVSYAKDTTAAYLPQSGVALHGKSLYEEAEVVFTPLFEQEMQLRTLEEKLGGLNEHTPEAEVLLSRYHRIQERLDQSGFYDRKQVIERVLFGLGFGRDDLERATQSFSSGWQMRIALAKILLTGADILLLDEPTNYLDLEARNWLEGFLDTYKGGVLIVSHDRYFLDVNVRWIAEIFYHRIQRFKGNFSEYERRRREELQLILQQYKQQQDEIEKLESFISRFRSNASKSRLVQSRVKRLEKIEPIRIPPGLQKIHFKFPSPPRSEKIVLRLDGVSKVFGNRQVLRDIHLELSRGEKMAVVGPNGAGKSTLLKILGGGLAAGTGEILYGRNVTTGFFSSDSVERWDRTGTVMEVLEASAPTHLISGLRNLLGAFLFRGDDIHKPVYVLSGGEKNRFALLLLLLCPSNLLILDEPTNHLDMSSKDVLLDALKSYEGTVVFVSHDRSFIQSLANKVLALDQGRGKLFFGDYEYYLWKKE